VAIGSLASAFASGFLLSLSVCLDLGIVNLAILRTAMHQGARPAFVLGLGSCFGDLTYFALSAFGVSAFLAWPPARWVLWLGGTAVLLFFTWKMLREAVRPHVLVLEGSAAGDAPRSAGPSPARQFSTGLSLALASPTAILWFAAVGGSVIASFAGQRRALAPFVAGFFVAGVAWSFLVAFGAAWLGRAGGPRLVRVLAAGSAALFAYFAVTVFRSGLRTL
jgi:L-lysine exporter family protein LysE/ArgO